MFEELESLPPQDRPRMLSTWTIGSPYLRRWQTGRWFMAMLIPIALSATACGVRGLGWLATSTIALMGLAVAFGLFSVIASGIESSNRGTFFRRREPIRFWIGAAILATCYGVMCLAGLMLKQDKRISGNGDVNLPTATMVDPPRSN